MRRPLAGLAAILTTVALALTVTVAMIFGGGYDTPAAACSTGTGRLGSSQVADAEAKLGVTLPYSREYVSTWAAPVTVTPGHTPVLSIITTGTTWAAVASGAQDAQIRRQAAQVAAIPGTVYLGLHHEPENDPAYGTPAQYIAAWRHYVAVYAAAGVTNVQWTWIMMADSFNGGGARALSYYPGDDLIDVVAADGYNWFGARAGDRDRTFEQVLAAAQAFASARGKQFIAAEVGMSAQPSRAAWITAAAATAASWTNLVTALWYNARVFAIGPDAVPALAAWAGGGTPAPAGDPATGSNEQQVWGELRRTFTPEQTAGIMGNMQSESGFDPFVVQGGGHSMNPADADPGGYGLVQWTPGSKLIPLLRGQPPSIQTEIAALVYQLFHGDEQPAGAELLVSDTVPTATVIFETLYERHAGPVQPIRVTHAQAIYDRHIATDSGPAAAQPCTPLPAPGSGSGSEAVTWALAHLGIPYLWGGCLAGVPACSAPTDPRMDCSGFTSAAWWFGAGVTLPRTSGEQIAAATPVPPGAEQPGDLIHRPGHIMLVVTPGDPGVAVTMPQTGDVSKVTKYNRTGHTFGRPQ